MQGERYYFRVEDSTWDGCKVGMLMQGENTHAR